MVKAAESFSEYAGVAQQFTESERVDPITRKPYIGSKIEKAKVDDVTHDKIAIASTISSAQGLTRVSKLGVADKAPTVVTDYLGKELSSTDHDPRRHQSSSKPSSPTAAYARA